MDHETSVPVNITMPVSSSMGAATPSTPSVSEMPMSPNFHGPGSSSQRHDVGEARAVAVEVVAREYIERQQHHDQAECRRHAAYRRQSRALGIAMMTSCAKHGQRDKRKKYVLVEELHEGYFMTTLSHTAIIAELRSKRGRAMTLH